MAFNLNVGYEDPGLGDIVEKDPHKNMKIGMAKWAAGLLQHHYPGHAWAVRVMVSPKGDGGIIFLSIPALMGDDHGYVCHLSDCWDDNGGLRTIVRGGGELLERYGIHRGAFSATDLNSAMNMAAHPSIVNLAPMQR